MGRSTKEETRLREQRKYRGGAEVAIVLAGLRDAEAVLRLTRDLPALKERPGYAAERRQRHGERWIGDVLLDLQLTECAFDIDLDRFHRDDQGA